MSDQPGRIPSKDCSNCQRRRVKCDRVWPACRKCGKRCLECPGYGLKLKWDQGVASRGSLMGRSLPTKNSALVSQSTVAARIKSPLPDPHLRWLQSPHSLQSQRLLAWFKERVAQRLAWVDGPQNPWRRIVLPLAEACDTVLSSVLALAASDLSSQYPKDDPWCRRFKDLSQAHHRRALALLTRELKSLSALPPSETCPAPSLLSTLVSVIIICNSDLLNAETSEWRMHLTAAREVLLVANNCPRIHQSFSDMQGFFLQEYYATSVWMHLTNFTQVDRIVTDPPTSNKDAALTDFVRVIHRITQLERLRAGSRFSDPPTAPQYPVQDIHVEIEAARANSLHLSRSINFWSDTDRRNFDLVVRMYYHATLIYSVQALSDNASADTNIKHSHAHIMNDLNQLTRLRTGHHFAQDLVWPLFIAGTELRGDRAAQAIIEHGFKTVMRVSRTLDRARVLSFLLSWWNHDADGLMSWIDYARERSSEYNLLIV